MTLTSRSMISLTARAMAALAGAVLVGGVLAPLAADAATGASGSPAAVTAGTADWRQTDVGGARSRFNKTETLLTAGTVGSLAYQRSFTAAPNPVGTPGCAAGVAISPVVLGGTVFAVLTGRLQAYDLSSGALLWSRAVATAEDSSVTGLAVFGSRVYVSTVDCVSASDPNSTVQVFNAASGAPSWSVGSVFGAAQSLVVTGTHAIIAGGSAGNGTGAESFDATTGAVQWTVDLTLCPTVHTALVVRGLLVVPGCDSKGHPRLQARSLVDGHVMWSKAGGLVPQRGDSEAATGTDVYALTTTGQLTAVDAATGATHWSIGAVGAVLAVDSSRVYTACSAGHVCAMLRSTGALSWNKPISGPIAVAGALVYSADGTVVAASNGATVTTIWSSPVSSLLVANGRVLTGAGRVVDVYALPVA